MSHASRKEGALTLNSMVAHVKPRWNLSEENISSMSKLPCHAASGTVQVANKDKEEKVTLRPRMIRKAGRHQPIQIEISTYSTKVSTLVCASGSLLSGHRRVVSQVAYDP